ncbi:hypothetical protein ATL40_2889 [Serinibacter salmoneus]|uniref:Helix-turn-helix protein n=1 Tax=Serinibacter salmoneus TaxID=556530 RepID=A0A2A9D3M7_9MICO|nr:hypothetical protein ATL40_2889 [Serinibacter salmoneus]
MAAGGSNAQPHAPSCILRLDPTILPTSTSGDPFGVDTPKETCVVPPKRLRRVRREAEKSPLAIAMAIPQGSQRVQRASTWLTLVNDRATRENLRGDRLATIAAVARCLLAHTDASYTTRPGWQALMGASGRSRRTVARALATLRAWGLLGIVATGRRGCFAPGGHLARSRSLRTPVVNSATDPINEAAVYVLAEPARARSMMRAPESVDANGTPPRKGLVLPPPARAREHSPQSNAEPLRGHHITAAQARRRDPVLRHRPGHWWPSGVTTDGQAAALRASHELGVRLPVLRSISSKHVRSILRPFVEAGWTVGDILIAIDVRPGDARWHHDGATGVGNVGTWLAYRLRHWTSNGTPRRSPSQRITQERAQRTAEHRAQRTAEHRAQREREAQVKPASPAFVADITCCLLLRRRTGMWQEESS